MAWNVVIAGGGFGGLYAARRLERGCRATARGSRSSRTRTSCSTRRCSPAPRRARSSRATWWCRCARSSSGPTSALGRVTGADPALTSSLRTARRPRGGAPLRPADRRARLGVARAAGPGLAEHGLGFKTLADAIALRNRALLNLEIAESLRRPRARREYLTFVFVGAGYAGLEGIAELQDYVADVIERYPRCRLDGTRWILVEALDRVMPEIPPSLAEFATRELRGRGIEIRTGTRLERWTSAARRSRPARDPDADGRAGPAGVKPPAVVRELGLPLTQQRPDRDRRAPAGDGPRNVWAIGDAAAVPDPGPAAQGAVPAHRPARDPPGPGRGRQRGRGARPGGPRKFRYRTLGVFVDMGQHKAVATMVGPAAARLPRLVRRPHLSPGDDAGAGAPAAADGRLDRRPAVRPRLRRAGAAGPSAVAWRRTRRDAATPTGRRSA